jgi:hypothetical protein
MELTPDHKPVLARRRDAGNGLSKKEQADLTSGVQLNLMDSLNAEIIQQLMELDLNKCTPLDAINILAELKNKAAG